MNQIKKFGYIGFEDLMQDLNTMEQRLLKEDGATAMELMAIEAKIRDRFQSYQTRIGEQSDPIEDLMFPMSENLTNEEIRSLIPQDLAFFATLDDLDSKERKKKKVIETVCLAGLLAVVTAFGVFGLATLMQLVLSWLA